ncbi:MAG: NUDIX hydrolase [Defluviitaleaceae bacterium]|nr:NUDIX hydrolase [Defluviitaleaceae bacterium]
MKLQTSTVSCGGVVIFRGKVLLLYKNRHGKSMGWVLPKGTLEPNETHKAAALREVKEESGVTAKLIKYLGKTEYSFYSTGTDDRYMVSKTVHWYLMTTGSFNCRPQVEEYFSDVGFYKQHEAYHLLKFHDERRIMRRAYAEYDMHRGANENATVN